MNAGRGIGAIRGLCIFLTDFTRMRQLKAPEARLSLMEALEFAVWGAYLTSMSNYMGSASMGMLIPWFFAIQGLVCLVTPPVLGIIADRYVSPTRLLPLCHIGAAAGMAAMWWMGYASPNPDKVMFTTMFTLSSACFMPTVALCNSIAFKSLRKCGLDTVKVFPRVRVWGTVGFIVAMIFVNFATVKGGYLHFSSTGSERFQFQCWQFLASSILSLILAAYSFALPKIDVSGAGAKASLAEKLGLNALGLLKRRQLAVFFIFSILMGMCVKVTNAYAGPFITGFMADPAYSGTFSAENATLLTTISQASEAFCILLIPFFMKRFGAKTVLAMSMVAWSLRFALFGFGNPGSGLWMLILSMIVYGIAFDFFNIAGAIYLERETDRSVTASAQGLWMTASNGIGASVGTVLAGMVVDRYCHWGPAESMPGMAFLTGDWKAAWLAFAAFALAVAVLFVLAFRPSSTRHE